MSELLDLPKGDLEKFGEALEELKQAVWEHHPLFVLARTLVELWAEAMSDD